MYKQLLFMCMLFHFGERHFPSFFHYFLHEDSVTLQDATQRINF
jgi:hypothetical protein